MVQQVQYPALGVKTLDQNICDQCAFTLKDIFSRIRREDQAIHFGDAITLRRQCVDFGCPQRLLRFKRLLTQA